MRLRFIISQFSYSCPIALLGLRRSVFQVLIPPERVAASRFTISLLQTLRYSQVMHISLESPNQTEVRQLIEALDAYQKPLYPAESHHGIDIAALSAPNVFFAVTRDERGQAVACGAIVVEANYGELKRMYTNPVHRGKGIARAILCFLEAAAQEKGCSLFVLETGYLQPEAIALYARCGYERCSPFGEYVEDPNSVFMRKNLT
ncbi:MAG: GNAT family N-acetyltransferase [Pseudomonadota bacterium]